MDAVLSHLNRYVANVGESPIRSLFTIAGDPSIISFAGGHPAPEGGGTGHDGHRGGLDEGSGDEGRQIESVAPVSGQPVQTPLLPAVQNAADLAVAGEPLAAHVVVVRPGTGELLAVASNAVITDS